MPRNASGVYSKATADVVAGTTITASWANTTLDDIAQGITDSLDRQGRGGMLAPFAFTDGAVSAPGAAWSNEPNTGLFRQAAGDLRMSILGTARMRWNANGAQVWDDVDAVWRAVVLAGTGNAVQPGAIHGELLRWDQNTDQAWEPSSAITIDDSGNLVCNNAVFADAAGPTLPGFAFVNDINSGMYRIATSRLGFCTAGVLALEIDASQNLLPQGLVDGRDVFADGAAQDAHIALSSIHFADSVSADGQVRTSTGWKAGLQVLNVAASAEAQPTDVQVLTQAEYDALSPTYDANTLYFIVA